MTRPMLIALYSPAMGMGKSTVAQHLVNHHGFTLVKFAGPLKDMIRVMLVHARIPLLMIERYVDGDLKETVIPELGVTCRQLQRTLGTEWGRQKVREDLWVRPARLKIASLLVAGINVVVDDMRFENELQMIKELDGAPVRVQRPGIRVPRKNKHVSEGGLDHCPMQYLFNDGSLGHLLGAVDNFVQNERAYLAQ